MNPAGSLLCSFTVRPPPSRDTTIALPTSSLVFVQYLAGLAVSEACRELLGPESDAGKRVRLKWPNDIYAVPVDYDPGKLQPRKGKGTAGGSDASSGLQKLGGVLVSTNFSGGEVDIVVGAWSHINIMRLLSVLNLVLGSNIGIGLNVLNDRPTTSLAQIAGPETHLTIERTAAVLACVFDKMWEEFVTSRGSFKPFMDLYLERWLHS